MADNKTVYGNINSIKATVLERLKDYIDNIYDPGVFIPTDISEMMKEVTIETKKEVAVFMDRKNRVLAVSVGDDKSVPLPDMEGRKSNLRLCGIRCLHTHPTGSVRPSDVDIQSLKSMRYDAMVVIGVDIERKIATGISASVLNRNERGLFDNFELKGPYSYWRKDNLNSIFDELVQKDREASEFAGASQAVKDDVERAILVGVISEGMHYIGNPLAELQELAESAGAKVVGCFTQKRDVPEAKTYIGRGLAEDLSLRKQGLNADIVIFDDELSPSQIRNLENIIGARVIDRTALILDIFASRAKSKEGRLQVELAQQKYRLPRLMGQGIALSRLGGGIGTRGPGETQLETDRRHIKRKINFLEGQLRDIKERRSVLRKERQKKEIPTVAVVGYTNAGKSTLVNALCQSDVLAEDKLFATLDTSVRRLVTPENRDFLLIDTVGFIKKLPHDLVEAFKSTLEETVYADLLLHVVDCSNPDYESCIDTVEKILKEIGAENRPRYLVLNKIDVAPADVLPSPRIVQGYGKVFKASATTGEGLDYIREQIVNYFVKADKSFEITIPYSNGGLLSYIHKYGKVDLEEYTENGIFVKGKIPPEHFGKINRESL